MPEEFGKYRLLSRLARGGMAEIFLAEQAGARGKPVVIKRVLPQLSEQVDFVQMFLDEARIAAQLHHPNLVHIFDLGEVSGDFYLAMEYVPGEDQKTVIERAKKQKMPVPFEYAAEVAMGAAEALMFAHDMKDAEGRPLNLVHRDVSPSNILFTWDGKVKLVDFGIARAESNIAHTRRGHVKGKIQYLSPEACKGQRADRRADLYALGIVLYELLTGTRLFLRDSALATLEAILKAQIPPLRTERPGVPAEIDAVVTRALATDPDERYQTAAELAADLGVWLAGRSWQRGQQSVDFLTHLFGAERRRSKLSLAMGQSLDPRSLESLKSSEEGQINVQLGPGGLDPDEIKTSPLGRSPLASGTAPAITARQPPGDEADDDDGELKTIPVSDLEELMLKARTAPAGNLAEFLARAKPELEDITTPAMTVPGSVKVDLQAITKELRPLGAGSTAPTGLMPGMDGVHTDPADQSVVTTGERQVPVERTVDERPPAPERAKALLPRGSGRGWLVLIAAISFAIGIITLVVVGGLDADPKPAEAAKAASLAPLAPPPEPVAVASPPDPESQPAPLPAVEKVVVATVRFAGLPAGARVSVDGVRVRAPTRENTFPVGPHSLVVEARGYQKYERIFEIAASEKPTVIRVELRRRRR